MYSLNCFATCNNSSKNGFSVFNSETANYEYQYKLSLIHGNESTDWIFSYLVGEGKMCYIFLLLKPNNHMTKSKIIGYGFCQHNPKITEHDMRVVFEVISDDDGTVLHREKPVTIPAKLTPRPNHLKVFDSATIGRWPARRYKAIILTRNAEPPINPTRESELLLNDFKELFIKRDSTADVTVTAEDEVEIRVHKLILTTRSNVFRTMFDIEMTEKERSEIVIKDFDSKVLTALFGFMYCGKVELNEEINIELLRAAKRYEVAGLAEVCEQFIIDNYCDVDIWDCLEIAYKFELQELFEFIATLFFV